MFNVFMFLYERTVIFFFIFQKVFIKIGLVTVLQYSHHTVFVKLSRRLSFPEKIFHPTNFFTNSKSSIVENLFHASNNCMSLPCGPGVYFQ